MVRQLFMFAVFRLPPAAYAKQAKELGMCLAGQLRNVCSPESLQSWTIVTSRFTTMDVAAIAEASECTAFEELLHVALPNFTIFMMCYDEAQVLTRTADAVQRFQSSGWGLRKNMGFAAQPPPFGESRAWYNVDHVLNESHDWLDQDPSYYFRSTLFQAYTRMLCAHWVHEQATAGLEYDWLLFSRIDLEWHAFPTADQLVSPHPLLWTHFRSVEMVAPHSSDRFHMGKSDIMLQMLSEQFSFMVSLYDRLENDTEDGATLQQLLWSSCLSRPGEARFTCPANFGGEDFLEFMAHVEGIPHRVHAGICFDVMSTRFNSTCGVSVEHNCAALHSHPDRGFVTEHSKHLYTHPFSWEDDYDNLLALHLHRFLKTEEAVLGRNISMVDVGAGTGTYVSLLRQFHPNVIGMDGRHDILDMLGEASLWHDITRPVSQVLRQGFDWVLSLNVAQHLLQRVHFIRYLSCLVELARVGIVATFLPGVDPGEIAEFFERAGFVRDVNAEQAFLIESGLLCCRDWLALTLVFRKPETFYNPEVTPGTDACPVAEDWMDYKVPAANVIWGGCDAGALSADERQITALYLKFFRLCVVSSAQFEKDVSGMDLEWRAFVSKFELLYSICSDFGSGVTSSFCSKLWGCFEMLERASARASCQQGSCEAVAVDCQGLQQSPEEAPALDLHFLFSALNFFANNVQTLAEALVEFAVLHRLAQIGRCRQDVSWSPARFVFEPGFTRVQSLKFPLSRWGKYLFRIHAVAGVRS